VSSRLDAALRQLVEAGVPLEDLNPEVLSRDYGDPRFANRPWNLEPAPVPEEPFMGDWLPALADKIGSGIGGAGRWVDKNVPYSTNAELLASFIEPLRGSDLGATGRHAGDVYPGAPKAAGMVIGPAFQALKYGPKMIKRLFGGADEVVFQPKLPGTARTETKKPEPKKPQEKTIDKLSREARQEEALKKQGELPQSLDYELEVREISQKQYDDLIEEGWDYQEILDAHPRIPYSVRKEGREILGLESPVDSFLSRMSRTAKAEANRKKAFFDRGYSVHTPETELGKYYRKLADDSGYTKAATGDDPWALDNFYRTLDRKALETPSTRSVLKGDPAHWDGVDIHELYREIIDYSTGAVPTPPASWSEDPMQFLYYGEEDPRNKGMIM
tara:strand:+ start:146 stop:1306 length:1161 start_codon:yes stop_codon:yes gene_type:complete